jgi:OFA family oxalate/formate antiporter-like MFS transporter
VSEALAPKASPRAWAGLAALSLLFFLITAGSFTALGAVLPDMVASLHWSWTDAGLGYTILGVACGLASFVPAMLIRRIGVRLTVLIGAVMMALGFACFAKVSGLALYWLGAGLIGVGFALAATIPATFVLGRTFQHFSAAFGGYFTCGALGAAAGPLLYAAVKAANPDWRIYWWIAGAVMLIVGLLTAAIIDVGADPDEAPVPEDTSGEGQVYRAHHDWSVRAALRTPQFWIIAFAYTVYLLCETSVNGLSVAHLTQRGIAPGIAGLMLSLQSLVNAGARAGGGVLGERIDPRRLVIGALALSALGIAALALAHGYPLMLTYVLGVGVGYGVSYLATTVLLLNYFGRRRNLELFSIMCLVSTLAAAGPWLGGWMRDRFGGFEGAFWLFAGLAVAVMGAVIWMKPPTLPQTNAMADSSRP